MRKLFYLGFCVVLAMGVGCAITNYALITDNNQTKQPGAVGATVNTNGKAHIREGSQIATLWPDGSDEFINFVDQDAQGNRVLTAYDNFSSTYPIFHSDFYCNPDWQGCAISTSQDPNIPDSALPGIPGTDYIFDYKPNTNCLGFRSLSLLLSSTRYYGECGRSVKDLASLVMMGEERNGSLYYLLTPSNFSIVAQAASTGQSTAFSLNADVPVQVAGTAGNHMVTVNMNNPIMSRTLDALANYADSTGGASTVTFQFNGMNYTTGMKFVGSALHKNAKNF